MLYSMFSYIHFLRRLAVKVTDAVAGRKSGWRDRRKDGG